MGLRVGDAPGLGLGLGLGVSHELGNASWGLSVVGRLPGSSTHRGVSIESGAVEAGARLCLEGEGSRACARLSGGALHARARGLAGSEGPWTPALCAGAQWAVTLAQGGRWSLDGVGELAVPLVRHVLRVDDVALWASPSAILRSSLVLRWRGSARASGAVGQIFVTDPSGSNQ